MQRGENHLLGAIAAMVLAVALPLAAQQAGGGPASAPAAPTSATAQATANANAAPAGTVAEPPLQVDHHEGFWGRLNPFARKKYVQQHLQPVRDRVNELSGLTSDNASSLARLDASTTAGLTAAQEHATQANQAADGAQQDAQQVASQANQLDQQVATVQSNLQNADQYQLAQTADLRFRPGAARLNTTAQASLQQFLGGLAQQQGYLIEVRAYSAGRGVAAVRNSRRLADAVVRYLVMKENIPLYRIYTVGLGNAPATISGAAPRRLRHGGRVNIRILRSRMAAASNDVAPAAASPANPQ
ncbi:MAG: OmpA family protein [Terriglobales bacterium]